MVPFAAVRRLPAAFRAPTCLSALIAGLNVPPGEVFGQRNNLAGIQLVDELSWTSLIPWIRSVSGAKDNLAQRVSRTFERRDPESGVLIHAARRLPGRPRDLPRGRQALG